MKRNSIIMVIGFAGVLLFLYFKYIYGWLEFRRNTDTPEEYVSHILINKEQYRKDKQQIQHTMKTFVTNHEGFFHSDEYFDSTEIIIDTILYNAEFNKLAILLITKNPTYRQLIPERNHKWYYDATCYLGIRQSDTIILKWVGPVFSNGFDFKSISQDIQEATFRTFVTPDTTDIYDYNIDDVRFWSSAIWNKW
jgi:hypothetical protein